MILIEEADRDLFLRMREVLQSTACYGGLTLLMLKLFIADFKTMNPGCNQYELLGKILGKKQ